MFEIKFIYIFRLNSAWHGSWIASTYLDGFSFEPSGTFTGIVWSMSPGLVWTAGSFFTSSSEKLTLFWRVAEHSGINWAIIYWPHAKEQVLAFFTLIQMCIQIFRNVYIYICVENFSLRMCLYKATYNYAGDAGQFQKQNLYSSIYPALQRV